MWPIHGQPQLNDHKGEALFHPSFQKMFSVSKFKTMTLSSGGDCFKFGDKKMAGQFHSGRARKD